LVIGATGLLVVLAMFFAPRKPPPASVKDSPAVPVLISNPDVESIRTKLRAKATPESLAQLASVASSNPDLFVAQIWDDTNDLPARTRAAQILVRGLTGGNLRILAPFLTRPLPFGIKKAIVGELAKCDAQALGPELLFLASEFYGQGKDGRDIIELVIQAFVTMHTPEGSAARWLERGVTQARVSPPLMRDLLDLVDRSRAADPILVAGAIDLIFAELPETSTDEINAKNRFVAELMKDSSEAAAVVLESVALGSSGRPAKIQAINAVGNAPRLRNAEILLKVIETASDPGLALEAAFVLRRVRDFLPGTAMALLEAIVKEDRADLSITLTSSMLESSEPSRRSHEFIVLALKVASKFKGTGGPRERDLNLYLAEYNPDPVKTLRELYPEIGWRVLRSPVLQKTDLPGVPEFLADIFRSADTPQEKRIQVATLLGKGGAFGKISDDLLALLEKTENSRESRELAQVIRTNGTDKDKERLATYIESLPPGAKRTLLTKER